MPTYRFDGEVPRVFMQHRVGPDFTVTRANPESRTPQELETPLLEPGDLVESTREINHVELTLLDPPDDAPEGQSPRRRRATTAPTGGHDSTVEG